MNDTALMITMTEAKSAAQNETTLEDRLKKAMKATRNHWMLTDEDSRFRAAIGGVFQLSNDEEKQRIEKEMDQIKIFSAMISGVPIDFSQIPVLENPIGLMKLWRDTA